MRQLALKIRSLEANNDEIAAFVQWVKENQGIEYASKVMVEYRDKALSLLSEDMPLDLRTALEVYVDFVIEREK